MVETNVKTRTDLLNFLAEKYNLQRYLEIGVQDPTQNFDKIKCRSKLSVDPDPNARATYKGTSDEFFYSWFSALKRGPEIYFTDKQRKWAQENRYKGREFDEVFDLVFIDGLHTAEQVKKDFENALKVLSPNGFIVLHDVNPETYERTIVPRPTPSGPWNGDVYKFAVTIGRKMKQTVAIDNGCMVVAPYSANTLYMTDPQTKNITWEYFDAHRNELLNLTSWDEFVKL